MQIRKDVSVSSSGGSCSRRSGFLGANQSATFDLNSDFAPGFPDCDEFVAGWPVQTARDADGRVGEILKLRFRSGVLSQRFVPDVSGCVPGIPANRHGRKVEGMIG